MESDTWDISRLLPELALDERDDVFAGFLFCQVVTGQATSVCENVLQCLAERLRAPFTSFLIRSMLLASELTSRSD